MSNFNTYRTEEESPSSDEKMDTGSDTFHSQDTPSDSDELENIRNPQVLRLTAPGPDTNSTKSSDSDDLEFPRNPEDRLSEPTNPDPGYKPDPETQYQVLRLSDPTKTSLNDSLVTKMSGLHIDSPQSQRFRKIDAKTFGVSPPRFSSTLTLTTSHPLMGLGSPEYPDLIPKKVHKVEDEKDLSLSSIEDERNHTSELYSPQRNTSKNNLYFTDNFVTAESILSETMELPPDVARVKVERRKLVPMLEGTPLQRNLGRNFEGSKIDCSLKNRHSTPKAAHDVTEEFHSVAEWSESPSQLRAVPNFELPIEMSSGVGLHNDLGSPDSPDVISSSTQEEKSAYQALLDPYTGSVALRHTPRSPKVPVSPAVTRRKIQLPVEDDCCSLDSLSDATLESEDEPIDIDDGPGTHDPSEQISDDDTKRSKSSNTVSYSDTIPEYSAAEEFSNERAFLSLSVSHRDRTICDMKVIEPYKRVVSHGGYCGGLALVVFSACHLPDHSRQDYTYVMDNLFLYVIWTLERLVTEEYILVYLHGSAGRRRLPTFHWLHECYKLIDRRLRKSLKHLYLVHPTFWLKSFVILTKPFISSKFFKKMSYIKSLDELMEKVPIEPNAIPDLVKQFDADRKR